MSSFRCTVCGERWPANADFKVCVECGQPTYHTWQDDPSMSVEDARSRLRHAQFERWCEEHGRREAA